MDAVPNSIVKVKWELMIGIRVAISAQFDNMFQASKYLSLSPDRLYKMHQENHEVYSLEWLVDVTERLGASVAVSVQLEKPRCLSHSVPLYPENRSWRSRNNTVAA